MFSFQLLKYNKYAKLESDLMNEVITILTSRSGNQIAKAFVGPEYVPPHPLAMPYMSLT
jgi:hypothetical protein